MPRSAEEYQERAYIGASRRTDRSLAARVQSALMASEIHKKRTGKGFIITEEIVLREGMYEEEDGSLPDQNGALALSRGTNTALDPAAMGRLARYHDVNRRFSESFPNVPERSQYVFQSMYPQLRQQNQTNQAHSDLPHPSHHNRSTSISDTRLRSFATPSSGSSEASRSQSPPIFARTQYQHASPPSPFMSGYVDPILTSTNSGRYSFATK